MIKHSIVIFLFQALSKEQSFIHCRQQCNFQPMPFNMIHALPSSGLKRIRNSQKPQHFVIVLFGSFVHFNENCMTWCYSRSCRHPFEQCRKKRCLTFCSKLKEIRIKNIYYLRNLYSLLKAARLSMTQQQSLIDQARKIAPVGLYRHKISGNWYSFACFFFLCYVLKQEQVLRSSNRDRKKTTDTSCLLFALSKSRDTLDTAIT